ncbi:serine/threonine-protein kinase [Nocardia sp. BMG51109]|uniref:serine/threonine-protein kinase n=1 Tax=Nocardia sp. BMG51109 TaxID=1056816 RepID=UPI00046458C3|nr:serine/threonine-protein kinase [Nocardia sp. BMG51109]
MARQFGKYRLDRLIGRGSVGEVWLARDTATDRPVALKILTITAAEDPDYRRRFEREARIGADLHNPHIVPIHDFGEQDGRLFLDMAHIPGADLSGRLRGGPIGVPQAVDIVSQIAEALDAAHGAGLIHRDVKPANIIVHASGFAYLIDFGIARAPNQTTITATGFTVGTLAYMAPERFTGHADVRSDVYSLACVLFECLTAQRPFGDTDPVQQLHAHLSAPPPRPSLDDPAIPAALDAVVARGMAKNADDRYASAGELAAAARTAVGMPHPIHRTPPLDEQLSSATTHSEQPRHPAPPNPQAPGHPRNRHPSSRRLPPGIPPPNRPNTLAPSRTTRLHNRIRRIGHSSRPARYPATRPHKRTRRRNHSSQPENWPTTQSHQRAPRPNPLANCPAKRLGQTSPGSRHTPPACCPIPQLRRHNHCNRPAYCRTAQPHSRTHHFGPPATCPAPRARRVLRDNRDPRGCCRARAHKRIHRGSRRGPRTYYRVRHIRPGRPSWAPASAVRPP